jgi:hypothetical protein
MTPIMPASEPASRCPGQRICEDRLYRLKHYIQEDASDEIADAIAKRRTPAPQPSNTAATSGSAEVHQPRGRPPSVLASPR